MLGNTQVLKINGVKKTLNIIIYNLMPKFCISVNVHRNLRNVILELKLGKQNS